MKKRKYTKRTKSTRAKSYSDYLKARQDLEKKGIQLKDKMSKASFEHFYERLRAARRAGEIKSQPWQELLRKERYITTKQAKVMAKAFADMTGEKTSYLKVQKFNAAQITAIGNYLNNLTIEERALYGGNYE